MTLKKGALYDLEITALNHKGDGVGLVHSTPVSVGRTIPGDQVRIKLIKKNRYVKHGIVEAYLNENPLRQAAPCPHFGVCGGCQLLDLNYSDQLTLKTQVLKACFKRENLSLPTILPAIGAPTSTYYRNKMEFSFGQTDDRVYLGLKKRGSYSTVVPLETCLLQSDVVPHILHWVGDFFSKTDLRAWDYAKHNGHLRMLGIRHSKADNQFVLNLVTSTIDTEIVSRLAQDIRSVFPVISGVLHTVNDGPGDGINPESITPVSGHPHLTETVGRFSFKISPSSFFQTNSVQTKTLYDTVVKMGQFSGSETVLDLYCGTGTIGLYLSSYVDSVVGIEEVPSAIEDARYNASQNGVHNISFHLGRVKNILKFNSFNPDVVVVDPPRSGIVPKAIKRIAELDAPTLIYVSCNPVTLAQNLTEFKAYGYDAVALQPVDMFPNTTHIESIVRLIKV